MVRGDRGRRNPSSFKASSRFKEERMALGPGVRPRPSGGSSRISRTRSTSLRVESRKRVMRGTGELSRVGFLNGRGKEGGMSNKTCFADTIERIGSRIASGGKYVLYKHIIAMGRNRVNVSAAPHAPPSAGAGLLELRHGAGEILWPHQCGGHPRSAAAAAGVDAAATLA